MKTFYILFISLICISFSAPAQVSKETKKKLRNLKGDVEKITIKTDKGELTIEGDDAEEIYDLIKHPPLSYLPFIQPYNHKMPPLPPMQHYKFRYLDDDEDLLLLDEIDDDTDIEKGDSVKHIKVFIKKDGGEKKRIRVIESDSLKTIEEFPPEDNDTVVIIKKDGRDIKKIRVIESDSLKTVEEFPPEEKDAEVIIKKDGGKEIIIEKKIK